MLRSVLSRAPVPAPLAPGGPPRLQLNTFSNTQIRPSRSKRDYVFNPKAAFSSASNCEPGPSSTSQTLRSYGIVYGIGPLRSRRRSAYQPLLHSVPGHARVFHSTPMNRINPLPFLGVLLKSSTALEFARMTARVGLTFVPLLLLGNLKSKKVIQRVDKYGCPDAQKKKEDMLRRIRHRTVLFHILIFIPLILYWATIIASLERTPLTGRWRVILLSPEEEEDIAAQLAGPGWYRAVGEILSADGAPSIIPPSDWRLVWVRDTLRRLESVIPTLQKEEELCQNWADCGPHDIPLPPPAEYPLRPRPRGAEHIRRWAELSCARVVPPAPHAIAGPPYSLLLVDCPDASNAFSYGFGPDGGGGIVVFSGFLDEVLARHPCPPPPPPPQTFLGRIFGIAPQQPAHPVPTAEQTAELATLLAHELAHLVLSHHIETLSTGSIVWPSVLSIVTDSIRAFIFPVTMLFGPFINDALAGMWKAGATEFSQLQEFCTSQKQEIEADVVSIRLLAHAGFDPREAVRFWEDRNLNAKTAECSPQRAEAVVAQETSPATTVARRIMGETHPVHEVRIEKLKSELERWEQKREEVRRAREQQRGRAEAA